MKKLFYFLKRVYHLTLPEEKHEEIVWNRLKKLFAEKDWNHGVYEKEKYIEAAFEIGEKQLGKFYYYVHDRKFHCHVFALQNYPIELTSELFILAAHFNNLLNNGVVKVDVKNSSVEYQLKQDLIVPVLFSQEIHQLLINHHQISQDVYKAFQRLVIEQEAPAIIIADLLKEYDNNNESEQ